MRIDAHAVLQNRSVGVCSALQLAPAARPAGTAVPGVSNSEFGAAAVRRAVSAQVAGPVLLQLDIAVELHFQADRAEPQDDVGGERFVSL